MNKLTTKHSKSAPHGDAITTTLFVRHVHYTSDTFSAGKADIPGTVGQSSFTAPFAVKPYKEYRVVGTWKMDAKWGEQFAISHEVYDASFSPAGLRHFLAVNPAFFGIGPAKAGKVVDLCENGSLDDILANRPQDLAQAGLTPAQIETLHSEWEKIAAHADTYTWLASFGLTHRQMQRVVEEYGMGARGVLTNNPYLLVAMHGFAFARVDDIARKMGVAKDHAGRLRACVLDVLQGEGRDGHTWVDAEDLLRRVENKCALDTVAQREALIATYGDMQRADEIIVWTGDKVGLRELYYSEQAIRYVMEDMMKRPVEDIPSDRIAYIIDASQPPDGRELNEDQANALRLAITSRACVVTGEAGTGKSFLLAAIVKSMHFLGHAPDAIALCAPTGRAAKRMEEAVNYSVKAATIHRLLGYSPRGGADAWAYGPHNRLPHAVVIVDECGMLDVELAARLVGALRDDARVVFIGDAKQLPPVGAGMFLRDVVAGGLLPHAELRDSVRQGGILKTRCREILRGTITRAEQAKREAARATFEEAFA